MSHTAQTTYYGLPIYEDKAGNQPTYLGDWNETMRTLDSSLNAVASQSSGVVNTAKQALSTAQQAQQTANAANTVANSAQQTASDLSDKVQTAQQTAEQANSAAETAQSTAESANSTAQQASRTASNALSQAQEAKSTANGVLTRLDNVRKMTIVTQTFSNSEGNTYIDINANDIKEWLDVSDISNRTLFASAINGDFTANGSLLIQSVAVNATSWYVRVWLDKPQSTTFSINFFFACI